MIASNTSNRDSRQGTTAVTRVCKVTPEIGENGLVTRHSGLAGGVSDGSDQTQIKKSQASRIKALRAAIGMSQGQLASALGAPQSIVSECESGKRSPSTGLLVRLGNVAAEHQQPETAEWFWRAAGVKGIPKYRRPRTDRHPRTGEKRKQNKALTIDRLNQDLKDAIIKARESGETWARITGMASTASGQSLSLSAIHRWYDLRVRQQSSRDMFREIVRLLRSINAAVQK